MSKVNKAVRQTLNSSSEQSKKEVIKTPPANPKPSIKTSNNVINPEIITYIARVQRERDKPTKKIIIGDKVEKKHYTNEYSGLNDNMNVNKTQKEIAKKGLLYLLNNLSEGTFCPDINAYFEEIKEMKKSELINQPIIHPKGTIKAIINNNKDPSSSLTPQSNRLRNDLIETEAPYHHNFKRRKDTIKTELQEQEGFGIKAFREDIDNGKKNNKFNNSNLIMLHFNKEKQAKLNIFPKNKKKKNKASNYINNEDNELNEDYSQSKRIPGNSPQKYNRLIDKIESDEESFN